MALDLSPIATGFDIGNVIAAMVGLGSLLMIPSICKHGLRLILDMIGGHDYSDSGFHDTGPPETYVGASGSEYYSESDAHDAGDHADGVDAAGRQMEKEYEATYFDDGEPAGWDKYDEDQAGPGKGGSSMP